MKKQLRRVLVLLLAFTMCFGSAVTLFAADAEVTCPGAGAVHTKANCKYTVEKVQEPLCGKKGYTLYACDECGAHFIDEVKEALNNCSEFKFVDTVEATCKEPGRLAHEECVVCEKVRLDGELLDDAAADEKLAIAKTANHVWGDWTTTADGKGQTRKCTVCGTSDTTGSHTHNYVIVSIEEAPDATMDKPGKATAKCSECDATTEVDVYPAHECKDYLTKIAAKEATCTEEGVKETYYVCKCGKAYKDVEATEEMTAEEVAEKVIAKHSGSTKKAITEATCEKYGMISEVCLKCGAQVGEVEVIAPTGHKYLTYPADIKDTDGNVIHKAGDVIVSYTLGIYDTDKVTETRYCVNIAAVDGDKYSAYRTYETADTTINTELEVTNADGTKSKVVFSSAVSAKKIETEVAGKGHTAVAYTTPADCQHGAFTFWYCTNENCSLSPVSSVEYTWTLNEKTSVATTVTKKYRTVDKNYNLLRAITDDAKNYPMSVATTNELSSNKTIPLTTTDGKTVNKQKEAVNANNHVVITKNETASTSATCEKDGLMAGTCYEGCGKSVSVVLDKLGHDYKVTTAATCSKEGKMNCSRCQDKKTIAKLGKGTTVAGILTKKEAEAKVKAEGHAALDATDSSEKAVSTLKTAATCTTAAVYTYKCSGCGNTWSYYDGEATGHAKPEGIEIGRAHV